MDKTRPNPTTDVVRDGFPCHQGTWILSWDNFLRIEAMAFHYQRDALFPEDPGSTASHQKKGKFRNITKLGEIIALK